MNPVINFQKPMAANGFTPNGVHNPAARRPAPSPGFDWLGAIVRRKSILIFMLALSGLLGYLYFLQQPKVFASHMKLMIWTQAPPRLINGETTTVTNNGVSVGKHVNLLKSEVVLTKAVEDGGLRSLPIFANMPEPQFALKSDAVLEVEPVEGAEETLNLTARGAVPEDLPTILTSIALAYQDILSEDSAAISKSSMSLIEKLQQQLTDEKSASEERYFELVQSLGLSPDPNTGQYANPFVARVAELTDQKAEREREFRDINERIHSVRDIQKLPADQRGELLRVLAIEGAKYLDITAPTDASKSGGLTVADSIEERRLLLQKLDSRMQLLEEKQTELMLKYNRARRSFGDKHPSVTDIVAEMESHNSLMKTLLEQQSRLQTEIVKMAEANNAADKVEKPSALATLSTFDSDVIQIYLASLNREGERLKNSLEGYNQEIAAMEAKAATVQGEIEELNLLGKRIQEKDKYIRDIVDQMSALSLLASNHSSTKVRVIDPPGVGYQVEPVLLKTLALFLFGGGLLGMAIIALLDWSDLSFRGPAEIKEKLGIPVISRIEKMDRPFQKSEQGSNRIITIEKPKSPTSEAYRACRTAMLFMSKQQNMKTFLITSPITGDGKSTTALNLAVSFAQGGMKTVIVDADLRRPRVDQYLGVEMSPGLKNFSLGEATVEEIIRPSEKQPNLSVVTAGRHFSNPSEFLDSASFDEFMNHLRSNFDIVIIDSPPVLPVADAMTLATRCDGVMLVIKIRKGVVLSSEKAVESLRQVDANLLGVIVNQVERQTHYSEYGRYGYSGYGGYSYYASRYYDKQNSKYYEPDKVGSKN
jgi:capsular exopolysaccharide synthesis family protein